MADKIVTQDPTKPGVNKVNGPTITGGLIDLAGLSTAGAVANDVVTLTGGLWAPVAPSGVETASNVGTGSDVFKQKVGANFEFRTIVQGTNMTITENANDITIAGAAGGAITAAFTSANLAISAGGVLTVAHGLSGIPTLIQGRLKNTTVGVVLGYDPGDEVIIALGAFENGNSLGIAVVPDLTNLNIKYGITAGVFNVINKSTGGSATITVGDWALILKAWL